MHEFSTVLSEEEKLHEERAMRLMREMRALAPPNQEVWVGAPYGWMKTAPATRNQPVDLTQVPGDLIELRMPA